MLLVYSKLNTAKWSTGVVYDWSPQMILNWYNQEYYADRIEINHGMNKTLQSGIYKTTTLTWLCKRRNFLYWDLQREKERERNLGVKIWKSLGDGIVLKCGCTRRLDEDGGIELKV